MHNVLKFRSKRSETDIVIEELGGNYILIPNTKIDEAQLILTRFFSTESDYIIGLFREHSYATISQVVRSLQSYEDIRDELEANGVDSDDNCVEKALNFTPSMKENKEEPVVNLNNSDIDRMNQEELVAGFKQCLNENNQLQRKLQEESQIVLKLKSERDELKSSTEPIVYSAEMIEMALTTLKENSGVAVTNSILGACKKYYDEDDMETVSQIVGVILTLMRDGGVM